MSRSFSLTIGLRNVGEYKSYLLALLFKTSAALEKYNIIQFHQVLYNRQTRAPVYQTKTILSCV